MIKSHIEQHLRHNASGTVSIVKEHDDGRQARERRCGWCNTLIGKKHGEAPDDHADGICKNCLTAQLKEVGLDKRRVDRVYDYSMAKSGIRHPLGLLKSARALQGYIDFNGLPISVENRRGNIRQWYDPAEDRHGMTRMAVPYGYIRGTVGNDGDAYDVFVGPHRDAPFVYIVRQMKAPEFTEFDEEKAMVGFRSQAEAVKLYRRHYDDPRFLGSVRRLPFAEFAAQVMKTKENGGRLEKAHVKAHLRHNKGGAVSVVKDYDDSRKKKAPAKKTFKPTRITLEQSLATHKDQRPKILRVKDAFKVNKAPYEIQEFQNSYGGTYEKKVYLPEAYTAAYMIQSGNSGVLARHYAEMSDGTIQGLDSALLLARPEAYQKVGTGRSLSKLTDLFDKVWEELDEPARIEVASDEGFLSRAVELAMHPSSVKIRKGANPVKVLAGPEDDRPLLVMSDGEIIKAHDLRVNAYGKNMALAMSRLFTAPRENAFLTKIVEVYPSGNQAEYRVRGDALAAAMNLPYGKIDSPGYKASGYRQGWVTSFLASKEGAGLLKKSVDMTHAVTSKFLTPEEQEAFVLKMKVSRPGDSFNLGQFMQGMRVELEHSDVTGGDALLTAKIVAAHLREKEDYYTALARMEKACAGAYLLKSSIRWHLRRTKSGGMSAVREHRDGRTRKVKDQKKDKKNTDQYRIEKETKAYTAWARERFPHITWELDGTTAGTMIPTLKQFASLAEKYPDAAMFLDKVTTYTKDFEVFPGGRIPAIISRHNGEITIGLNPGHYGDRAEMVSHLKKEKVKKELLPVLAVVYPITHEFGHLLYRQINAHHDNAAETWAQKNGGKWRHTKLARKNIKEAFAEGFAELHLYQKSGLGRYAKALSEFLEKYRAKEK